MPLAFLRVSLFPLVIIIPPFGLDEMALEAQIRTVVYYRNSNDNANNKLKTMLCVALSSAIRSFGEGFLQPFKTL